MQTSYIDKNEFKHLFKASKNIKIKNSVICTYIIVTLFGFYYFYI